MNINQMLSLNHFESLTVTGGLRPLRADMQPEFSKELLCNELISTPLDAPSFGPSGRCCSSVDEAGKQHTFSAICVYCLGKN